MLPLCQILLHCKILFTDVFGYSVVGVTVAHRSMGAGGAVFGVRIVVLVSKSFGVLDVSVDNSKDFRVMIDCVGRVAIQEQVMARIMMI